MPETTFFPVSGNTLSPAEKSAIKVSFVLLAKETKGSVKFWGRVSGVENDYLLAEVGTEDLFKKQFFYSVDGGLTWMLLNPTTETQRIYCSKLRGVFFGNPQYEYKIEEPVPEPPAPEPSAEAEQPADVPASPSAVEEDEAEEKEEGDEGSPEDGNGEEEGEEGEEEGGEDGDEDGKPKKPEKKKKRVIAFQETVRLSYFIEQVEYTCSVVPRGAYLLNELGVVIPNKFFEGLSWHAAGKLSQYCHTRRALSGAARRSEDPFDFMETIDGDVPGGVWSVKFEPLLNLVVGSNLLYPGFTFYHRPESSEYGQFYFGDGQQNLDLCFML
eukprot:RCo055194